MYLIWAIINTAFIILFVALILTLVFKGKKLFDNDYGNLIITFLAIGILGLLNKDAYNPKNEYVFPANEELTGRSVKSHHVVIEDNLTLDIHLTVRFKKDASDELIPSFSRSNTTGFMSGLVWNYKYADIDKLDANTYTYTVVGIINWNLFGIKLYTQEKELTGTFKLNE